MPSSPAIVLLDFGGTLDADGVPWGDRFYAVHRQGGGKVSQDEFVAAFRESDRLLAMHPGVERMGFRAMIRVQAELLDTILEQSPPDPAWVADRFYVDSLAVVQRNRPALDSLVRAGHRMAVVSNFSGNLDCCLEELDLTRYFGVTVDSTVLGYTKPDARMFLAATEVFGPISADSCWIVGDNPEADIRPAAALGFRSVWIAPPARQTPADLHPTARVDSLSKLPALLAQS
jgi:FMN phosphatase YigB (HAD superfamily)